MNAQEIYNSPILWFGVVITLVLILVQTFVILKKSYKVANQMNIGRDKVKEATKASIFTAIGPSFVAAASAIPLALAIGVPIAMLRVMVIGAPEFELVAATSSLEALGVGIEAYTKEHFLAIVLALTVAISLQSLVAIVLVGRLESITAKLLAGNAKRSFAGAFSICSVIAALYLVDSGIIRGNNPATYAWIGGFIAVIVLTFIEKKTDSKLLRNIVFPLSALIGMFVPIVAGMV